MTTPDPIALPEPRFGEWLRGIYASEKNPHRDGMYVRTIHRDGRFNPGKYYEVTDGKGDFWTYLAESTTRVPATDTLTPAPQVQGDMVLVPREPTEEMLEAYQEAMCGIRNITSVDDNELVILWKAMLSAAPQQHGQEVDAALVAWLEKRGLMPDAPDGAVDMADIIQALDDHERELMQPQQPAEAVAERRPDGYAYRYPDGYIRHSSGREINGMLPVESIPYFYRSQPPAIDIGKLRELVARWRRDANYQVIRVMAKQQIANAEELAALIGDGGEAA